MFLNLEQIVNIFWELFSPVEFDPFFHTFGASRDYLQHWHNRLKINYSAWVHCDDRTWHSDTVRYTLINLLLVLAFSWDLLTVIKLRILLFFKFYYCLCEKAFGENASPKLSIRNRERYKEYVALRLTSSSSHKTKKWDHVVSCSVNSS